ncbi:F-box/kelch-repeat protein At1g80440 [Linum perenne]
MAKDSLIPGLPDDIGRSCLLRLTFPQFQSASSVSKSWSSELRLPDFRRLRKLSSTSQKLFLFTGNSGITVFEPASETWTHLPGPGLTTFSRIACVGSDLVLLGGLDPVTWEASRSVYIFSFLTGKWRRGSDIPGPTRLFFGCASDRVRTVFLTGGHDREKSALRSCVAYDVVEDKWAPLPDMTRERDECHAVFHRGMFHVIGGYCTEQQGRFERDAEAFDAATWEWDPTVARDQFLDTAACPQSVAVGSDGVVYMCQRGEVVGRVDDTWQVVTRLPSDVADVEYVAEWEGKLLVVGTERHADGNVTKNVYVLELKTAEWRKMETPVGFSGAVHGGCFLEI